MRSEQERAFYQGKALRQQNAETAAAALRRAVDDVLSGAVDSCKDAARGRGLPPWVVQRAVRAEKERRAKEQSGAGVMSDAARKVAL